MITRSKLIISLAGLALSASLSAAVGGWDYTPTAKGSKPTAPRKSQSMVVDYPLMAALTSADPALGFSAMRDRQRWQWRKSWRPQVPHSRGNLSGFHPKRDRVTADGQIDPVSGWQAIPDYPAYDEIVEPLEAVLPNPTLQASRVVEVTQKGPFLVTKVNPGTPNPVPVPGSLMLFLFGFGAFIGLRKRMKN